MKRNVTTRAVGGVVLIEHTTLWGNLYEISSDEALVLARELEAAGRLAHRQLIEKAERDT